MQTALRDSEVPEAEPLVADLRQRYDPSAKEGMPAHITVLYPFAPVEALLQLEPVLRATSSMTISFASCRRFSKSIGLAPDPPEPLIHLTQEVMRAFPGYKPYGGAFSEVIPHLTVAEGDDAALDEVEAQLRSRLNPPLRVHLKTCSLCARTESGWREISRIPFQ
jgi:hypothetical protein